MNAARSFDGCSFTRRKGNCWQNGCYEFSVNPLNALCPGHHVVTPDVYGLAWISSSRAPGWPWECNHQNVLPSSKHYAARAPEPPKSQRVRLIKRKPAGTAEGSMSRSLPCDGCADGSICLIIVSPPERNACCNGDSGCYAEPMRWGLSFTIKFRSFFFSKAMSWKPQSGRSRLHWWACWGRRLSLPCYFKMKGS